MRRATCHKQGLLVQAEKADITLQYCKDLDRNDVIAATRDAFMLTYDVIYLNNNSLGPPPKATGARLAQVVQEEWSKDLIGSWNKHGWFTAPQRVGGKIARIIGAPPEDVVVTDSTSINLFKVASAALRLRPDRMVILSERGMFPTDLYMLEGLIAQLGRGHTLRLVDPADVASAATEGTALVLLQHVSYSSGRLHDMRAVTAAAHAKGALIIWDVAHSAGVLQLELADSGADYAVGCGYKFLNGGPGAPSFLYVAKHIQAHSHQPLCGWFGHSSPFAFEASYSPAPGVQRFLCGTPPMLSLAALEVGVDLALQANPAAVQAKSRQLGALFQALMEPLCVEWGFTLASPSRPDQRGSQLCYAHPKGYAIVQALIMEKVIADFRQPDILRFGFGPLTVRYEDMWEAVDRLQIVMECELWDEPEYVLRANTVT